MKTLNNSEIEAVSGGLLAEEAARWLGAQLGYLVNSAQEYIHNEGFRQQYG